MSSVALGPPGVGVSQGEDRRAGGRCHCWRRLEPFVEETDSAALRTLPE